ncbi:hypothetical protein PAPYR_5674 [Paratrimastix pyriformis]|uniref:Uncharacterized protein n=1 Tax=Paratrimastix pyriformis TaxID=342808 RepID=A0ABQ8UP38_9EUKA|nr:hypothetical protein PAPYR_5674 [Paratrimastix pyriformis]
MNLLLEKSVPAKRQLPLGWPREANLLPVSSVSSPTSFWLAKRHSNSVSAHIFGQHVFEPPAAASYCGATFILHRCATPIPQRDRISDPAPPTLCYAVHCGWTSGSATSAAPTGWFAGSAALAAPTASAAPVDRLAGSAASAAPIASSAPAAPATSALYGWLTGSTHAAASDGLLAVPPPATMAAGAPDLEPPAPPLAPVVVAVSAQNLPTVITAATANPPPPPPPHRRPHPTAAPAHGCADNQRGHRGQCLRAASCLSPAPAEPVPLRDLPKPPTWPAIVQQLAAVAFEGGRGLLLRFCTMPFGAPKPDPHQCAAPYEALAPEERAGPVRMPPGHRILCLCLAPAAPEGRVFLSRPGAPEALRELRLEGIAEWSWPAVLQAARTHPAVVEAITQRGYYEPHLAGRAGPGAFEASSAPAWTPEKALSPLGPFMPPLYAVRVGFAATYPPELVARLAVEALPEGDLAAACCWPGVAEALQAALSAELPCADPETVRPCRPPPARPPALSASRLVPGAVWVLQRHPEAVLGALPAVLRDAFGSMASLLRPEADAPASRVAQAAQAALAALDRATQGEDARLAEAAAALGDGTFPQEAADLLANDEDLLQDAVALALARGEQVLFGRAAPQPPFSLKDPNGGPARPPPACPMRLGWARCCLMPERLRSVRVALETALDQHRARIERHQGDIRSAVETLADKRTIVGNDIEAAFAKDNARAKKLDQELAETDDRIRQLEEALRDAHEHRQELTQQQAQAKRATDRYHQELDCLTALVEERRRGLDDQAGRLAVAHDQWARTQDVLLGLVDQVGRRAAERVADMGRRWGAPMGRWLEGLRHLGALQDRYLRMETAYAKFEPAARAWVQSFPEATRGPLAAMAQPLCDFLGQAPLPRGPLGAEIRALSEAMPPAARRAFMRAHPQYGCYFIEGTDPEEAQVIAYPLAVDPAQDIHCDGDLDWLRLREQVPGLSRRFELPLQLAIWRDLWAHRQSLLLQSLGASPSAPPQPAAVSSPQPGVAIMPLPPQFVIPPEQAPQAAVMPPTPQTVAMLLPPPPPAIPPPVPAVVLPPAPAVVLPPAPAVMLPPPPTSNFVPGTHSFYDPVLEQLL